MMMKLGKEEKGRVFENKIEGPTINVRDNRKLWKGGVTVMKQKMYTQKN
jgi:hypothetical protein